MQANALAPSTTLAEYLPQQTAWIGPALGPLIAEFVSPSVSSAVALKQAAQWLGWVLVQGPGKPDLNSALTAAYEAYQALVNRNQGGAPGGGIRILHTKPVSPDLSPFQRAVDALFG